MGKPELALYAKEDGTGRAYRHPLRTGADGKPLTVPSVTTVLGLVDKPALIQWAADRTLDWAIDNASLLFVKAEDSARRSGRYRWQDVRDERAEVGTGIHETIEAQHTGLWKFPPLDPEQRQIMNQWGLLNERYEITPHRSEFTVFGQVYKDAEAYAGTADGQWSITDRETGECWDNLLIDIKTSKNIWPEHWLQLAALHHSDVLVEKNSEGVWYEPEKPDFSGTAIIHLRADKHQVIVETDPVLLDLQFEQFMAYRRVWQARSDVQQYVKGREKEGAVPW